MDVRAAYARRYAKACDACHRKKIKCEANGGACTLCRKTGQECIFTRIEKSDRKRSGRGRDLSALEDRLKDMEALLRRPQIEDAHEIVVTAPPSEDSASSSKQSPCAFSGATGLTKTQQTSDTIPKERALHLTHGFLAACNRLFPVFNAAHVLQRMDQDWPPDKQADVVWWTTALVVLCSAHRLRAMSDPSEAEDENREASRYLGEILEVAPTLPYGKPTLATAQVLLAIATLLRGTAMSDPARMFVGSAAHILQDLDAHKEEKPDSPYYVSREDRARAFWVAYVHDKNMALITGKPPVFYEQEISRLPPSGTNVEGFRLVQSLDNTRSVNFLVAGHRLAVIQGQLWSRLQCATAFPTPGALITAQNELNALLLAWRTALPFNFKPQDLMGQWPKFSIIYIILLHFQYFQTLVEVNRQPPAEEGSADPLFGTCPTATSLRSRPYSTQQFVVSSARDALELASLSPRGNFQHVWLFIDFSISAVLTLLVNGIVEPLDDALCEDFRRIDEWLHIIEALAETSERPDLLEKKQFLVSMRAWTLRRVKEALTEKGANDAAAHAPTSFDTLGLSNGQWFESPLRDEWPMNESGMHPDIFPMDQTDWNLMSSFFPMIA